MSNRKLTLDQQLTALEPKALDDFSRTAIGGARGALADADNPLRLNFFSTAMRILYEHMMGTLAPAEQVMQSPWFEPEKEDGRPTRRQRIAFAIQGGLLDDFVENTLSVDPDPLRSKLIKAVDDLSKQVHGREDTVVLEPPEQDAAAEEILETLSHFLEVYHDCRSAIVDPIRHELDGAAVDTLLSETILEVDVLANHHGVEHVEVERVAVKNIGPDSITYRAEGSVSVTLQWGSNSDLRQGDGAEMEESFPFDCDIETPLENLWDLSHAETSYEVDTSEWYE